MIIPAALWLDPSRSLTRPPIGYDHVGGRVGERDGSRVKAKGLWYKMQAGQAKTKFRGQKRVEASFVLAACACNLIRLPKLLVVSP